MTKKLLLALAALLTAAGCYGQMPAPAAPGGGAGAFHEVAGGREPDGALFSLPEQEAGPSTTSGGSRFFPGPPDPFYARVPILMYHEIGRAEGPYPGLYVTPEDFERQMGYLKSNGYVTITIKELFLHWREGKGLAAKPVVVSFDDGYESTYARAYPVLAELGFTATIFLQAGILEKPGALTRAMVKQMIEAGWELGSHTFSHPDLTLLKGEKLAREVSGSRAALEEAFAVEVLFFSYPAGRFNQDTARAVKAAGYLGAVTTLPGLATPDDPYGLRRIRVSREDGLPGFTAKVPP